MVMWSLEVTGFKFKVEFDLRGCLEAVVASEPTKRVKYTWI